MGVIGTALILCLILVAIFAPMLEPYSFKEQNMEIMNDATFFKPSTGNG